MPQDYAEFRAHWPVVVSAAIGVGVGVTGAMVYSLGIMLNPLADAFGWSRAEISAAKTFLTLGFAVTAAIFIGLAAGSEVDLLPYLTARYFGLKSYGRLYGWVFIFFYVGVGIAPPAFGRVFDLYGNYDSALSVAIGTLGLGVLGIATLGKAPKF